MANTRSKTYIYLIGGPKKSFETKMLSTCKEALQAYFSHHKKKSLLMKNAGKFDICQLKEIWSKARIPIAESRSIVRKFETVLKKYRNIYRNKKRRGPAQQAQEKLFHSMSKKLFAIAHN